MLFRPDSPDSSISTQLMDLAIFRLVVGGRFHRESLDLHFDSELDTLSSLESTPLHYAILGGNEETVRYLLSRGALVNAHNIFRETALHWACKEGNPMIVRLLLQHGAFPNVLDTERNTPLHWAAEYDHKDIILLLLENNCEASLHIKNEDGLNPLQVAKQNRSKQASEVLRSRPRASWTW